MPEAHVIHHGRTSDCIYCGSSPEALELQAVSDQIDEALQRHFTRARMQMNGYERVMHKDPDSSFDFEPGGEQTVYAIMSLRLSRTIFRKSSQIDTAISNLRRSERRANSTAICIMKKCSQMVAKGKRLGSHSNDR
jgi:hypothetical protein